MQPISRSDLAVQLQTSSDDGFFVLFDLLIEGLVQPDDKLSYACTCGLAALGTSVVPHLKSAEGAAANSVLKQRLNGTIALIQESTERGEVLPHSWIVAAILDALRPYNADLNRRTMDALQYLPTVALDGLITLAAANSSDRWYCLRLLSASERYNRLLSTTARFHLLILASHPDAFIRAKAIQLILRFRPQNQLAAGAAV